jgi:hypothetical protein
VFANNYLALVGKCYSQVVASSDDEIQDISILRLSEYTLAEK